MNKKLAGIIVTASLVLGGATASAEVDTTTTSKDSGTTTTSGTGGLITPNAFVDPGTGGH